MSRKSNPARIIMAVLVPAALALGVSAACAGNVGVNVNVNLGTPPPPPIVEPVPVVSIDQDVDFVYPAPLGFYVAVGVPYDLFYVRGSYYLCRDGRWFRAHRSYGPWVATQHRYLPPGLRKHDLKRIRSYRNAEYDVYHRDRDHYHGKHFRTGKDEWKAQHKAGENAHREGKHEEKEHRKEMKQMEKEERKQHKHDND